MRDFEQEMHVLVCEFYSVANRMTQMFGEFRKVAKDHKAKLLADLDKINERKADE